MDPISDTNNNTSDKIETDLNNDGMIPNFKRTTVDRIFVNRNILLEKIKHFGFDMDYTLAEYISPEYEKLIFRYAVEELISIGYPEEISKIIYDPKFAARGVIYDKKFGNLLKIDPYGNIMNAVHGFDYLEMSQSEQEYRNRFIDIGNQNRFFIFNTLFEFPSMFLICATINCFEKKVEWKKNEFNTGMEKDQIQISYETIFNDIIHTFDKIHFESKMKQETIENISLYIKKDPRLPTLLRRIKDFGRKSFLVTNSNYWYTDNVLSYLFKDAHKISPELSDDWKTYFDIIIVEARKPNFFGEGTAMCQIDTKTGKKSIGIFKGKVYNGIVFSGGNSEVVSDLLGAHGRDILYVGDHIFGDILKSKKKQGWRTYLVIPELLNEATMWINNQDSYREIEKYEALLSNVYKNMNSCNVQLPSTPKTYTNTIMEIVIDIERSYGVMGSLLRCGTRPTFFSNQMIRFADLYSHTCYNLINYPFFYLFRSPAIPMPHEFIASRAAVDSKISSYHSTSTSAAKRKSFRDSKPLTLCAEEMNLESSENIKTNNDS